MRLQKPNSKNNQSLIEMDSSKIEMVWYSIATNETVQYLNGTVNGTLLHYYHIHFVVNSLDEQTQVDSKPAGQPEHASLNQCQLIASNRQELVLWAPPAGGGDKVSL